MQQKILICKEFLVNMCRCFIFKDYIWILKPLCSKLIKITAFWQSCLRNFPVLGDWVHWFLSSTIFFYNSRGEIFELLMGLKTWVELTLPRPGQLGKEGGRLHSTQVFLSSIISPQKYGSALDKDDLAETASLGLFPDMSCLLFCFFVNPEARFMNHLWGWRVKWS